MSITVLSSARALEALADEHERREDAEDRVERHRDRDHHERQVEGVHRLRGRHRLPGVADPVLEGAEEDHHDRDQQQQGEVAERDEAQAQAARAGPGWRGRPRAPALDVDVGLMWTPVAGDGLAADELAAGQAAWRRLLRAHMLDPEEDHERDHEQDHRDRGGAGRVAALDLAEDEDRGDLGLEGDVARDQDQRAELADRARERERAIAGEDRRGEVGEDRCGGRSSAAWRRARPPPPPSRRRAPSAPAAPRGRRRAG